MMNDPNHGQFSGFFRTIKDALILNKSEHPLVSLAVMIFVDGLPFSSSSSQRSERDTLLALMEHPLLVSSSHSFKCMQEREVSAFDLGHSASKYVYVFQREFATVDRALVHYVGTDEATTCVGLVIRNRSNGMTSVAHMDFPTVVDVGLSQMLAQVVDHTSDAKLDVHLVGGFDDVTPNHASGSTILQSCTELDGYSFPLCAKIIETLQKRPENFHIQTLFVLGHNTKRDSLGNAYPIFTGFVVEASTGSLIPASFDKSSRCPDEIVRRIRVASCDEDPSWDGKLLETYDTQTDRFAIAPCCWTRSQLHNIMTLQHLSDAEILLTCSTSPSVEAPDFVETLRRQWNYLIKHPDWRQMFPEKQARVFERRADGDWKRR